LKAGKPIAQALYESKDVMDYAMRGNFQAMMYLTDIVPFLNARLQGLTKLGRAAADSPKSMAMKAGYVAAFSIGLAFLTLMDDDNRKNTTLCLIGTKTQTGIFSLVVSTSEFPSLSRSALLPVRFRNVWYTHCSVTKAKKN
jgi:hypothetical protein